MRKWDEHVDGFRFQPRPAEHSDRAMVFCCLCGRNVCDMVRGQRDHVQVDSSAGDWILWILLQGW